MRMITVALTIEEAAEVHTLCDMEAKRYQHHARNAAALPAISRMFAEGGATCSRIAELIESQLPDFAELAERGERDPQADEEGRIATDAPEATE